MHYLCPTFVVLELYFAIDLAQSVTAPSVICQGSDATLQCVVLRNGQPVDARWRRNGMLIDTFTDSSYEFVLNHTLNAITILLILNIRLEDNNVEYSCSDSNNNINSTVILNVTGMLIQSLFICIIYVYQ